MEAKTSVEQLGKLINFIKFINGILMFKEKFLYVVYVAKFSKLMNKLINFLLFYYLILLINYLLIIEYYMIRNWVR